MQRRPARLLLVALSAAAALPFGAATGAQANTRTRSWMPVPVAATAHPRVRSHGRCTASHRTLGRHGGSNRSSQACARGRKARRSHHVRLLLHPGKGSGHEPRAGIRPPVASAGENREAMIAAVLAKPCTETEATPVAANIAVVREAVLCLINQERADQGEQPLRINPKLQAAAESHSNECIELDYFAHVSPSGETPVERIQATGYVPSPFDGYVLGENLAWGTYELATPKAIVAAWIASPPHLANILEARYTETGIGVTPAVPSSRAEGAPGATYAQEFGVIIT